MRVVTAGFITSWISWPKIKSRITITRKIKRRNCELLITRRKFHWEKDLKSLDLLKTYPELFPFKSVGRFCDNFHCCRWITLFRRSAVYWNWSSAAPCKNEQLSVFPCWELVQVLPSGWAATGVNHLQRHSQLQRNPEEAPGPCVRHEWCIQRRAGYMYCSCRHGDTTVVSKEKF